MCVGNEFGGHPESRGGGLKIDPDGLEHKIYPIRTQVCVLLDLVSFDCERSRPNKVIAGLIAGLIMRYQT